MEKIKFDKKYKGIILILIRYDEESGGNVFGSQKERIKFKKYMECGEIPDECRFALWDLIGLYKYNLSKEDQKDIKKLYAQLTTEEFKKTKK